MSEGLTVCYIGNFGPSHSTETHVARSLEALGHEVVYIQEGETPATGVFEIVASSKADFLLWTATYGLSVSGGTHEERTQMVENIRGIGVPSVSFHLDRWWGLSRQDQIYTEPFFRTDHVFTADGGHDDMWESLGINHHWLPPAVYHGEAVDGTSRSPFFSDVAFVGSWRQYGHEEWWPQRKAMLNAIRRKYGRSVKFWPVREAIRGPALADLYASVKVVVGDSCLAPNVHGDPMCRYWSDRVAETTGRGGFLIHPHVPGILDSHPSLVIYEPGNWEELIDKVDHYLAKDTARESLRQESAAWTRERHTYKVRMQTVIDTVL